MTDDTKPDEPVLLTRGRLDAILAVKGALVPKVRELDELIRGYRLYLDSLAAPKQEPVADACECVAIGESCQKCHPVADVAQGKGEVLTEQELEATGDHIRAELAELRHFKAQHQTECPRRETIRRLEAKIAEWAKERKALRALWLSQAKELESERAKVAKAGAQLTAALAEECRLGAVPGALRRGAEIVLGTLQPAPVTPPAPVETRRKPDTRKWRLEWEQRYYGRELAQLSRPRNPHE